MKKIIIALLLFALVFSFFVGCSSDDNAPASAEQNTESAEQNTERTEQNAGRTEQNAETAETGTTTPDVVSVSEALLFEQEGVRLTVTGLEESWMGTELQVLIENDSDVPVTVQVRNVSVNGFMLNDAVFSPSVTPGNRVNDSITFMSNGLETSGIDTFGVIELSFVVFHSESWDDIFQTEFIGIETSAARHFTQALPNTIETIYDQDGISISYMGLEESFLGEDVVLFIINDTDRPIIVQARDEAVNGLMVTGVMSATVLPGRMTVTSLGFGSWDLEANNIEVIETVAFRFAILDYDNWANTTLTDMIELTP